MEFHSNELEYQNRQSIFSGRQINNFHILNIMKESQNIRLILYSFRVFGFYPFDIHSDSSNSLHLKQNKRSYIYAMIVTLINFINVVEVTVKPKWEISNFHGFVSYTRLIMVSFDALVCCMESLFNSRLHVEFFETIAQLDAALIKLKIRVSCIRLRLWVKYLVFVQDIISLPFSLCKKNSYLGSGVYFTASCCKHYTTNRLLIQFVRDKTNQCFGHYTSI